MCYVAQPQIEHTRTNRATFTRETFGTGTFTDWQCQFAPASAIMGCNHSPISNRDSHGQVRSQALNKVANVTRLFTAEGWRIPRGPFATKKNVLLK